MLQLSHLWLELKLHQIMYQAQSILQLEATNANVRQRLHIGGLRPLNDGCHYLLVFNDNVAPIKRSISERFTDRRNCTDYSESTNGIISDRAFQFK